MLNEFKNMGEFTCPFCLQQLEDQIVQQDEKCCNSQKLITDNGKIVCNNCTYMAVADEFVNFYENIE